MLGNLVRTLRTSNYVSLVLKKRNKLNAERCVCICENGENLDEISPAPPVFVCVVRAVPPAVFWKNSARKFVQGVGVCLKRRY